MIGLGLLALVLLFVLIAPTLGLGQIFNSNDDYGSDRSSSKGKSKGMRMRKTGKIRGTRGSFMD